MFHNNHIPLIMNILYPITLDSWNQSIPSKFREIVINCQDIGIHFFASSKLQSDIEQQAVVARLWERPNLSRISTLDLLTKNYDIVHNGRATATNLAVATTVRIRGMGRTKHIFTVSIEPSLELWNYRHAQLLTGVANVVIANSQAVANGIERYYRRVPDHIIPNGVDTDFFSPSMVDETTRLHYNICEPYVLFIGTLEARKRPDVFISIAEKLPEVEFVMIGGNPGSNPLRLDNLPKNVKALGLIPKRHVRDLHATSSALLFPSELEGLPNAVLEALAMGVPVIAQPKSSLPEIIQDGQNGWLVDAQKLDLWVDLVRDLSTWSGERRDEFRRRTRSRAIQTYSWSRYAQRHVELYRQLGN
jgi:alpha-maltose-1-phosphate synthase